MAPVARGAHRDDRRRCADILTATHWKAYQAGAASERAAVLSRSVEILRERAKTDETIHDLDDAALCRALGGSVSDDGACL